MTGLHVEAGKTGYRVRILVPAGAPEITPFNNTVIAP